MPIDDDAGLRDLLERTHSIAFLGIKDGADDDAFRVPRYLQSVGYRILPVNPKLRAVLGEPCVPRLDALREPADLVDVFRASQHLPGHVDEILALEPYPAAGWLQLGIQHDPSARRLEQVGIAVVQNRCLLVEHRRLVAAR